MQGSRNSANGGRCPRIHSCRWSCQVRSRAPIRESVGAVQRGGDAYDACKRKLAQQQVRAFLVLADFAKGDGTWSVPTLLRSWFVARSGLSVYVTPPPMPPRVNDPPSRGKKKFYVRCLDGPARRSSSGSSSPRPALRGGSRPPVDLRAVLAALTRFGGGGGVESCRSMASDCLRFCFL